MLVYLPAICDTMLALYGHALPSAAPTEVESAGRVGVA
jgi:hypothetical protein